MGFGKATTKRRLIAQSVTSLGSLLAVILAAHAADPVRQGKDAFGDAARDVPGVWHKITVGDLPQPYASQSARNAPQLVPRRADTMPKVPPGFAVTVFARGFREPREMKVAPNGDVFLAESGAGRVRVLRANGPGKPPSDTVFAKVAERPFGIAFYPPGPDPQWVYVASTGELVRFPYRVGDTKARGAAQPVLRDLPRGGHWTRDIVATPDGKHLLLAIGSSANIAQKAEPLRADILQFDPAGSGQHVFAAGLRNPVALAFDPVNGALWASVNERDGLGDNLPPDYVTHIQPGGFYGWPNFYIGDHRDPRVTSAPPVPGNRVIVPDVLIQPHSAPLGIAFYTGTQFPAGYRNDLFVALHGSWNRGQRTGYKLIRVELENGKATGAYQDFMTGFVMANGDVWGRPVGVAMTQDGALLVSDDGSDTIWRIAYGGVNATRGAGH